MQPAIERAGSRSSARTATCRFPTSPSPARHRGARHDSDHRPGGARWHPARRSRRWRSRSNDPDSAQKIIRKQAGENDLDFLKRIARRTAWRCSWTTTAPWRVPLALHLAGGPPHAGLDLRMGPRSARIHAPHHHGRPGRGRPHPAWIPAVKTELTVSRRVRLGPAVAGSEHHRASAWRSAVA